MSAEIPSSSSSSHNHYLITNKSKDSVDNFIDLNFLLMQRRYSKAVVAIFKKEKNVEKYFEHTVKKLLKNNF